MVLDGLSLPVEGIVGWARERALEPLGGDTANRWGKGTGCACGEHVA